MKLNFWRTMFAIALFAWIVTEYQFFELRSVCRESMAQTERAISAGKDAQRIAERWRVIALSEPAAEVIRDDVAREIVTKGNTGGSPTEPNQPLGVVGYVSDPNGTIGLGSTEHLTWGDPNDFALSFYQDRVITVVDDVGFCVDPNGRTFCEVRAERGYYLDLTDLNWLTDASIRRLCKSGRVCAVLGHQWGVDMERMCQLNVKPPGWEGRKCHLCGKVEQRQLTEWEAKEQQP